MTEGNLSRLQKYVANLTPPDKRAQVLAAMEAGNSASSAPASTPASTPTNDSDATAAFILQADARRRAGCPVDAPSGLDEASQTSGIPSF